MGSEAGSCYGAELNPLFCKLSQESVMGTFVRKEMGHSGANWFMKQWQFCTPLIPKLSAPSSCKCRSSREREMG